METFKKTHKRNFDEYTTYLLKVGLTSINNFTDEAEAEAWLQNEEAKYQDLLDVKKAAPQMKAALTRANNKIAKLEAIIVKLTPKKETKSKSK